MEGLLSSYSTLRNLLTWEKPWRSRLGAEMTHRNCHEWVIVSMANSVQPARSIHVDLLCVSFINIWKKSIVPCVVDYVFKMTMNSLMKVPRIVHLFWINTTMLPNFHFYFMMLWFVIMYYCYFVLSFLKLKLLGVVGYFVLKAWVLT